MKFSRSQDRGVNGDIESEISKLRSQMKTTIAEIKWNPYDLERF